MSGDEGKISGGCLCGALRYEAEEPPFRVGYCHCRRCQKALGNVVGTAALFWRDRWRVLSGTITWYQSSPTLKRGFCGICGTPIVAQHDNRRYSAIWLGTLDEPQRFEPSVQWYCESKLPWVTVGQALPDDTEMLADHITDGPATASTAPD